MELRWIRQVCDNITQLLTYTRSSSPLLGNLYIADYYNNRIRKVTSSTGIISTIVGTGTGSYSGDGGAATSATIYRVIDVALDASGMGLLSPFTNKYLLIFDF